jgi:hypothetical protein
VNPLLLVLAVLASEGHCAAGCAGWDCCRSPCTTMRSMHSLSTLALFHSLGGSARTGAVRPHWRALKP